MTFKILLSISVLTFSSAIARAEGPEFVWNLFAAEPSCIEFSTDGRQIIAGTLRGEVIFYDAASLLCLAAVSIGVDEVRALASSPDSRYVALVTSQRSLSVLDTVTMERRVLSPTVAVPNYGGRWTPELDTCKFSADGSRIVWMSTNGSVFVFATDTGRLLNRIKTRDTRLRSLTLDPGFERLWVATYSGEVRAYSLDDGRLLKAVRLPVGSTLGGIAFHPPSDTVAVSNHYDKIYVLASNSLEVLRTLPLDQAVEHLTFTEDGTRLFAQGQFVACVFDYSTGSLLRADDFGSEDLSTAPMSARTGDVLEYTVPSLGLRRFNVFTLDHLPGIHCAGSDPRLATTGQSLALLDNSPFLKRYRLSDGQILYNFRVDSANSLGSRPLSLSIRDETPWVGLSFIRISTTLTASVDPITRTWGYREWDSRETECFLSPALGRLFVGKSGYAYSVLADSGLERRAELCTTGRNSSSGAHTPFVVSTGVDGLLVGDTRTQSAPDLLPESLGMMGWIDDDGTLVVGHSRDWVRLWSLPGRNLVRQFPSKSGKGETVHSACLSRGRTKVILGTSRGRIRVFDVLTGLQLRVIEFPESHRTIQVLPTDSDETVAFASRSGMVGIVKL